MLKRFHKLVLTKARAMKGDESGVTAIEYGLIAGAIAVAIIGTLMILGSDIEAMFSATSTALNTASGG